MSKILVTGAAGFIGFHLSNLLLKDGYKVVGIDNLNDYYDVSLKKDRLNILKQNNDFEFELIDISDRHAIQSLFSTNSFDYVVNLAAQAGVRYSLENPWAYLKSNIDGFLNILEGCRNSSVKHLVYASSSSVYGANVILPFSVEDNVDHPVSLYAATKKSNELMAHCYSTLYNIPVTGLRFFTVYGPWGRPDMALFLFTKAILKGEEINVFNEGDMRRDFTYIDDIVDGVYRVIKSPPKPDDNLKGKQLPVYSSFAPYRIYNIGNNNPENLMDFIKVIEKTLGIKAKMNFLPIQPGDVKETSANIEHISQDLGFMPKTSIEQGISNFISWYREYYKI